MTDATNTEHGTMYHASVDDFRRSLVQATEMWRKDSERYGQVVFGARQGGRPATPAERDANAASLMAHSYSYTLAAILRLAEREFGRDVALALATEADNILTNGDDANWNADVMPGEGT